MPLTQRPEFPSRTQRQLLGIAWILRPRGLPRDRATGLMNNPHTADPVNSGGLFTARHSGWMLRPDFLPEFPRSGDANPESWASRSAMASLFSRENQKSSSAAWSRGPGLWGTRSPQAVRIIS